MVEQRISVNGKNIITNNSTFRIRSNKVLIKNSSNYIVTLFRVWPLVPGDTLELGAENNDAIIDTDMTVEFAATLFDSLQPDIKSVAILEMNRNSSEAAWHGTARKDTTGLKEFETDF